MRKLKPKPVSRWFHLFGVVFLSGYAILGWYLGHDFLNTYLSSPDTFFYYRGVVLAFFSPVFFVLFAAANLYGLIVNRPPPPKVKRIVGPLLLYTGIGLLIVNVIGSFLLTDKIEKDGYIVCKVKLHSVKYAKNRALCKKNKSDD